MIHLLDSPGDDSRTACGLDPFDYRFEPDTVVNPDNYPLRHYGDQDALEAALRSVDCPTCRERKLEG